MNTERLFELCLRDLTFDLVRGSGPGGQNVNKVSSAVQLRFDVRGSKWLDDDQKNRLIRLAGKKITVPGVLVIMARRHRTQNQNREDAVTRFEVLFRESIKKPNQRIRTQPSGASKERRLQSKKQKGLIKKTRLRTLYD